MRVESILNISCSVVTPSLQETVTNSLGSLPVRGPPQKEEVMRCFTALYILTTRASFEKQVRAPGLVTWWHSPLGSFLHATRMQCFGYSVLAVLSRGITLPWRVYPTDAHHATPHICNATWRAERGLSMCVLKARITVVIFFSLRILSLFFFLLSYLWSVFVFPPSLPPFQYVHQSHLLAENVKSMSEEQSECTRNYYLIKSYWYCAVLGNLSSPLCCSSELQHYEVIFRRWCGGGREWFLTPRKKQKQTKQKNPCLFVKSKTKLAASFQEKV